MKTEDWILEIPNKAAFYSASVNTSCNGPQGSGVSIDMRQEEAEGWFPYHRIRSENACFQVGDVCKRFYFGEIDSVLLSPNH
ncbi:MAG: hypothetical protein K0Q50_477 [Vampirovibrio sp.]|jgi:hypothetical protein|nr:hypothetical protein [Vampirovibrio sp.]